MKINEMIKALESKRAVYGNVEVAVHTDHAQTYFNVDCVHIENMEDSSQFFMELAEEGGEVFVVIYG